MRGESCHLRQFHPCSAFQASDLARQDLHSVPLPLATLVDFIHYIPEDPLGACVRLHISSFQSYSGFLPHTEIYVRHPCVLHHRAPSHIVWTVWDA